MAAAECNYKEIDCQLKEQFIHALNNKTMLDEVIRELTTKNINQQTTSEDVLIWAKSVEVQRVQVAILSDITESQKFDKVKVTKKQEMHPASPHGCVDIVGQVMHLGSAWCMERHVPVAEKWATSRRYARAGKTMWFMKWEWRWLRKKAQKKK